MDVTIGESQAGSDLGPSPSPSPDEGAQDDDVQSGESSSKEGTPRGWEALAERGWAVMHEARRWVVANPFAALGIALATGFVAGRVVRVWMLRP